MKLRNFLLNMLTAVCIPQAAVAVPAFPYPIKVRQADGTFITIRLKGDERGHLAFTTDGYPLYQNPTTGNYEYAALENGRITGSGIIAADAQKRNTAAKSFLRSQNADKIMNAAMENRKSTIARKGAYPGKGKTSTNNKNSASRIRISDIPTTGDKPSLVILLEFNDVSFTRTGNNPKQFFCDMLNKEGYTNGNGANGSAADFYKYSSNGLYRPSFDVYGPVKLSGNQAYYGSPDDNESDNIKHLMEGFSEACKKLDGEIDFSKYDTDNDGYVDNIYFFYAGKGEADGGGTNTIWPHSALMEELTDIPLILDGVHISRYATSQEIDGSRPQYPVGIGTFVHEFGHVLGLPDLYDIFYGAFTFTPGTWDTMDSGSYNNNGNTPPAFSAYERFALGWQEPIELSSNISEPFTELPELNKSKKAYRISVNGKENEYFILENRQQKEWDEYIPWHGMLMWHIDEDQQVWNENTVNIQASHQRVDIVEADNKRTENSISGDPFPGTSNITEWTMTAWNETEPLGIDGISEENDTIRFMVSGLNYRITPPQLKISEVKDSSITIRWHKDIIAHKYIMNAYIVKNGERTPLNEYSNVVLYNDEEYTLDRLLPDTEYIITLSAERGSYSSEDASLSARTEKLAFEKRIVENLIVKNTGNNSFTAGWDIVDHADSYEVTLSLLSIDENNTTEMGYDFTDKDGGMPDSWKYKGGTYASVANYYGQAAPSLRFNQNGSYITFAYPDTKISALRFWTHHTTSFKGAIHIERYANGEWSNVKSLSSDELPNNAQILESTFDKSDSIRIRFERNAGTIYIDDIMLGCHPFIHTPLPEYNERNIGNVLEYTFNGLDMKNSYSLVVRARSGNSLSIASNPLTVGGGVSGPDGIEPITTGNNAPMEIFTISGSKVSSTGNMPDGIYIIRKGNTVKKVLKKE
ncbi:M6 family metalloprotease domain-containing protein [Xylanibacter muris]|uniref:M6 family metalloprotease domain-containing protein n=1 Tax=Xylanibacter muris TaxID=2736290 RepID=A0ABX2AQ26_9BACT|nr:M6 family metalloprotease domain-containing protein [Xylanibacter muris]NPD93084.1 M6 family metalloprotease domain-containing protein [Xylanibacter muris]